MLLLLLSEVNNTTIFLMALLNVIDGKNRWSSYMVTLLSLLLAIDKRPTRFVVMAWYLWRDLASRVFGDTCGRQNHWMILSQCWPAPAWLQHPLLFANDGMLSLFCVIDNSFNKLINQLQFNLFVVCGWHSLYLMTIKKSDCCKGMILLVLLNATVVAWEDVVIVPWRSAWPKQFLRGTIWLLSHPVINNVSCRVAQPCRRCLLRCNTKSLWPMHLLRWRLQTDQLHCRCYSTSLQW